MNKLKIVLILDITAIKKGESIKRMIFSGFEQVRKQSPDKKVHTVVFSTQTLITMHEHFTENDWEIKGDKYYLWEAEIELIDEYPNNKICILI